MSKDLLVDEKSCRFCIHRFDCEKRPENWTEQCEVLKQKVQIQPQKEQ